MAYATILGVALSVLPRSGDRVWENMGDHTRAVDGTLVGTGTHRKRSWPVQSKPLMRSDADAWAALLLGRGDTWKFSAASTAGLYSSKGIAATTSGTVAPNVAGGPAAIGSPKKVQISSTSYARWTPTGDDALAAGGLSPLGDYTLVVWRLETAVWHQYIIVSSAGTITRYKDGASIGTGAATFCFVTAGVLQLGDGTNADDFSDLTAIPVAIPAAWVPSWYAYTRPFPALPQLELGGEIVSNPTTPLTVLLDSLTELDAGDFATARKRLELVFLEAT